MEGLCFWKEQFQRPRGDIPASPGAEHLPGAPAAPLGGGDTACPPRKTLESP